MVSGIPSAIVFREGKWLTKFEDASPFLLHVVKKEVESTRFVYQYTQNQANIRKALYNGECKGTKEIYGQAATCQVVSNATGVFNNNGSNLYPFIQLPYNKWVGWNQAVSNYQRTKYNRDQDTFTPEEQ